jgi:hypothetical protein
VSRTRTTLLLAALVLVAGCSGAGLGADSQAGPDRSVDGGAGAAVERAGGGTSGAAEETGGESDPVAQARSRQLVYTATVELRVDDYERTRSRLDDAAERRDGFVADASARRNTAPGGNYTTATVTYRVPAEEFEGFLAAVNGSGAVVSAERSTEDVTDQVVDLEARLRTLRAQRDRLRTLYERANTTEEVLAVERRLSEVQTEIERAEARKAALERQVALSTVTVRIEEPRPGAPPEGAWYDTPLVAAFLASVDGVVVTLRALAVAGAYAAPYLLAFVGPPVAGVVLAWRRWGGRGSAEDLGLEEPPTDDGAETGDDEGDPPDGAG